MRWHSASLLLALLLPVLLLLALALALLLALVLLALLLRLLVLLLRLLVLLLRLLTLLLMLLVRMLASLEQLVLWLGQALLVTSRARLKRRGLAAEVAWVVEGQVRPSHCSHCLSKQRRAMLMPSKRISLCTACFSFFFSGGFTLPRYFSRYNCLGLLQFCEQGLTEEERFRMLRRATSLLLSCCWLGASLLVPRASRGSDSSSLGAVSERTRRFFESLPKSNVAEGAGGTSSLRGLEAIDEAWSKLRDGGWQTEPSKIVLEHGDAQLPLGVNDEIFDVAVAGGTLGIFYAAALQNRGVKCVVIERGKVKGRDQEWNISAKELETLVRLGILTNEELKSVISVEFNPVRVGFNTDTSSEETKTFNMFVKDVLNLGVLRDRCPPAYHHKLALFLGDRALPDPYYGQASDFEKVLDLVEKRAVSLLSEWQATTD